MPLTTAQIREILKLKQNKSVIQKAVKHENRIRLHCETTVEKDELNGAVTEFLDFADTLLLRDKYETFVSLFRMPVQTVVSTDRIFTALQKVFDGRNPVFKYEFSSPEDHEDWWMYRRSKDILKRWKTEGFETMKTAINSVVIVDLPEEQEGDRPEPYFYFLPISSVEDFKEVDGKFEWIIFNQDNDKIAIFDDESYRVFDYSDRKISDTPLVDNPHGLGYCPAKFLWTTPLSYKQRSIKKSPITPVLSKLDMLLFFIVSNEHLNMYGRYPVYSEFSSDCDYENHETGEWCDRGHIRGRDGNYMLWNGSPKQCPICSKKRLGGAGSIVVIDPPSAANDEADLRNPVQMLSVDRDSLDYNNEDIEAREQSIYAAITGFQGMPINDQAVNEKQVLAIFESLEGALVEPQRNFEAIIKWVDETMCKLRYGSTFISASIGLGTERFIMSASSLLELYENAKKAAFNTATLDMLEDRYYETEFRNNPEQIQRHRIISNLDPFRHKSDDEVSKMFASGSIKYEDYMVKLNFSSFIMRFEREVLPVTEYGINSTFDQRIASIKEQFDLYALEMKPEEVIEKPLEE